MTTPIFRIIVIRKKLKPNYPHTKVTHYNSTLDNPTVLKLIMVVLAKVMLQFICKMYGPARIFADR